MTALYAFLSKIDPELLVTVLSAVYIGGKWVFHKIKGDKQKSLKDTLWPSIEGVIIKLAESEFVVTTVREKLTKAAYEALGRAGIKKNAIVDAVIAQLVDAGVTEVRKRVEQRKAMAALPGQIEAMLKAAEAVKLSFVAPAPEKRTVPTLLEGLPGEVVRICPEAGCDLPLGHEGAHGAAAEPAP